MNEIVKKIYICENDIWGEPQTYKNIKLYPIKISEIKYKDLFYELFCYPKNFIPDKIIFKMSYLKYLLYVLSGWYGKTPSEIGNNLKDFLEYITKKDKIEILVNKESDDHIINIGDVELNEFDFENIREIVLEQNGLSVDYIEEYNIELEEKLKAFQNNDDPNFDDEIFLFCSILNKTLFEIKNYTLYQFKYQFKKMVSLIEYKSFKPLELSGQIYSKNKGEEIIKHYLRHNEKLGRYDSILVSREKYTQTSDIFKATKPIERGI